MPRYLSEAQQPDITTSIFGQKLDAPFGVAPVGLAGLQWPGCEPPIAKAARQHNVLHVLSTHATQSLEKMKESVTLAPYKDWRHYEPLRRYNVEAAYLNLSIYH